MATANKGRGEVVFKVGSDTYRMRPTFDCLARLETVIGKGFFEYVSTLKPANVTLLQLRDFLVLSCEAGGTPVDESKAGEVILQYGLLEFINGPFAEFIARAAGYHEDRPKATKDAGK